MYSLHLLVGLRFPFPFMKIVGPFKKEFPSFPRSLGLVLGNSPGGPVGKLGGIRPGYRELFLLSKDYWMRCSSPFFSFPPAEQ